MNQVRENKAIKVVERVGVYMVLRIDGKLDDAWGFSDWGMLTKHKPVVFVVVDTTHVGELADDELEEEEALTVFEGTRRDCLEEASRLAEKFPEGTE